MVTVRVEVDSHKVWAQMNLPGGFGGGAAFRDAFCSQIEAFAVALSPVNDPLNALHRGGVVGTYKASWQKKAERAPIWIAAGSVTNNADHAGVVEFGRQASRKWQKFSWVKAGGGVRLWHGTRARAGNHVLDNAVLGAIGAKPHVCAVARGNNPYAPSL